MFQTIITHSKSDKLDDAKKEAKEILEEKGSPKVTSKLIAPDIPCVRKGDIDSRADRKTKEENFG